MTQMYRFIHIALVGGSSTLEAPKSDTHLLTGRSSRRDSFSHTRYQSSGSLSSRDGVKG